MVRRKVMSYKWGEEVSHWMSHHEEVEELVESFLRYVKVNTTVHEFKAFKTMLGIRVHDRYCNLLLQAGGLVLTVTRNKEPIKYVVESPADFVGALRWILNLDDPKGRPMEQVIMRITRDAKKALAQLVVELGLGPVVCGLLLDPTKIEIRRPEVVEVQRLLADFVGEDIVLIVIPLTDPGASPAAGTD